MERIWKGGLGTEVWKMSKAEERAIHSSIFKHRRSSSVSMGHSDEQNTTIVFCPPFSNSDI